MVSLFGTTAVAPVESLDIGSAYTRTWFILEKGASRFMNVFAIFASLMDPFVDPLDIGSHEEYSLQIFSVPSVPVFA